METEIISFLKGNDDILKSRILKEIEHQSELMNYEAALELKNELDYINVVMEKQKVESYTAKQTGLHRICKVFTKIVACSTG